MTQIYLARNQLIFKTSSYQILLLLISIPNHLQFGLSKPIRFFNYGITEADLSSMPFGITKQHALKRGLPN